MAEATRCRYTDEFKSEAVRLTRESGKTLAEVVRNLGISDNVLYRWVNGRGTGSRVARGPRGTGSGLAQSHVARG
jgi:transposase